MNYEKSKIGRKSDKSMTDKRKTLKISFVKSSCLFVKLMTIERHLKVATINVNQNTFAR